MVAEGDLIGFLASVLVLATFAMKDMRRLRVTAILSNVAFIAYGAFGGLLPVLGLHLLLLPLNIVRLRDETRTAPTGPQLSSKAVHLAIEALHHAEVARGKNRSVVDSGVQEIRTRISSPRATPSR